VEKLLRQWPVTIAGRFGRNSLTKLVERLRNGRVTPDELQRIPIEAVADPAWWDAEDGVVRIIVLYVDRRGNERAIRVLAEGVDRGSPIDFDVSWQSIGVDLGHATVLFSCKLLLTPDGKLLDQAGIRERKERPDVFHRPDAHWDRVREQVKGMRVCIVGRNGSASTWIPVLVDEAVRAVAPSTPTAQSTERVLTPPP
jgi:hypothetical protein